jgi:hypothetical protein
MASTLNDWLMMKGILKEAVVAYPRYGAGICLEGLRQTFIVTAGVLNGHFRNTQVTAVCADRTESNSELLL